MNYLNHANRRHDEAKRPTHGVCAGQLAVAVGFEPVAKREQGAGTRVLLDQVLLDAGIAPESVQGPVFNSHLEVALAVASGIADTGIALRAAAVDLDLDFVPIMWERYDLVPPADALGAAEPLIRAARSRATSTAISLLPGYTARELGTVVPVGAADS